MQCGVEPPGAQSCSLEVFDVRHTALTAAGAGSADRLKLHVLHFVSATCRTYTCELHSHTVDIGCSYSADVAQCAARCTSPLFSSRFDSTSAVTRSCCPHPPPACAELIAEDFGLLQLYAESFQAGGGLATYLKSYRSAAKKKAKDAGGSATESTGTMSAADTGTVVMVTASALAAQVYPDSKFGSLHAKQLTGEAQHGIVHCWVQ